MWRFIIKQIRPQLFQLLIVLAITSMGSSQTLVEGSISYVSKDNAYMDLGRKAGISVGDTIQIYRGSDQLGIAVVTQTSGSSSALTAFAPSLITWQIGDIVHTTIQEILMPAVIEKTGSDPLEAAEVAPQVTLDSLAFTERKPSTRQLEKDRFRPKVSGYLSTRIDDRGGDPLSPRNTSASVYGQLKVMDMGIPHLDASIYFRGNQDSRTDQFESRVYSVMLQYEKPGGPLKYVLGRVYHPLFSSLGSVDGIGVTWHRGRHTLAMLAGALPVADTNIETVSKRKLGFVGDEQYAWGNLGLGLHSEFSAEGLTRNFLETRATYKAIRGLRIRTQAEFDLDLQNSSQTQSAISLTRFRSSLNWRLGRRLLSNLRYSYRENILDLLDTAETEFDLAARHASNASISWSSTGGLNLSARIAYRTDGDGKSIQTYGLTGGLMNSSKWDLDANGGVMFMTSYVSQGGRLYASVEKKVLPWLDLEIYDELFVYSIQGDSASRTRHLPELSLKAKVAYVDRLRLRTRLEQEDGVTYYRLSLSASKQF